MARPSSAVKNPWDNVDCKQRMRQLEADLREAAKKRGYPVCYASSGRCYFVIHAERVEWFLYERSVQRKIPLTKQERKSWQFAYCVDRGWKFELQPSGWMMLVVKVDYHSEIKIAERPRYRLKPEEIMDRFDALAAEAAAKRKRRDDEAREERRRAAARAQSRRVEDGRWNAMHEIMSATEEAQRLRCFINTIATQSPMRPDQERRVRKFVRWARAHADAIDPMTKGFDYVLARLWLPK
jgi:hypothetical protein